MREIGNFSVGVTSGVTSWGYILGKLGLQNPVFDPLQNIGNRPKIGAKPRKSALNPENRRIEGRKLPYNLGIDFYLID
jgi:hypothetical protein